MQNVMIPAEHALRVWQIVVEHFGDECSRLHAKAELFSREQATIADVTEASSSVVLALELVKAVFADPVVRQFCVAEVVG